MMKPESLIDLARDGNASSVEEEWMGLLNTPDCDPTQLRDYDGVLAELCQSRKTSTAEELAWATIESLIARDERSKALELAGRFLLAIKESQELRSQTLELYRQVYEGGEGLEALLEESGLGGGRPVRRAIRTLDLCLVLAAGDYLVGRHEDTAARVEEIDRSAWRFRINTPDGDEEIGAVHLADQYLRGSSTEFRVMRVFAPDKLLEQLKKSPSSVVVDICKRHQDRKIDSQTLEGILVPELLSEADWKKWWLRARQELKRSPNVKVEGRSPYIITYSDAPISLEQEMWGQFEKLHDPLERLDLVEKCVRECKARNEQPNGEVLGRCHDYFATRAAKMVTEGATAAPYWWVMARRIAELGGIQVDSDGAVEMFRTAPDPKKLFESISSEPLLEQACTCLERARSEDWAEHAMALLPAFPLAICDRLAGRLIQSGQGPDDLELMVQRIMASPAVHFEALLWLWDGPTHADNLPLPAPVNVLSRILHGLDECKRGDIVSKEQMRQMAIRVRAVLSARKYQRFDDCLEQLDGGMAEALHTRIRQLDLFGTSIRDRLLAKLRAKFSEKHSEPETPPWLLDDVLFVTQAGLAKKQNEIEHHVNVKMRENAKAIGAAAERGDLSENSEYKFALEERDLLRARLGQMNAEVADAKVLAPTEISTDHVAIGSRVTLQRETDGEEYQLTILGPWESDIAERCYNYKTPLAQKILGKHIGDTAEFDHTGASGTYKIVTLENALTLDL